MSKKGRRLLLAGVLTTMAIASLAIVVTRLPFATARKSVLKTPWGEPDLQGIWTRDVDVPLERPAKYANQEFFSDAERNDLDRADLAEFTQCDAGGCDDYTFAVRASETDEHLLNVGKAYSGLTDVEIAQMTGWFLEHTIDDQGFRRTEPGIGRRDGKACQ